MSLMNARGTKDIGGEDAVLRREIVQTLKQVFELYGYNPLETPTLERFETLTAKYAGGEEILKEIFKLKDQGKRNLALRYDLTVPLARYVAMNPTLKLPFKRYAIGNVFRDGPIKLGRYREFTQCDVDVVGNSSPQVDGEIIQLAKSVFDKLNVDYTIKVNSRKVLDGLLENAGVAKNKWETTILSIDKLEKFGKSDVEKELSAKGLDSKTITKVMKNITISGSVPEKLQELRKKIPADAVDEIEQVLKYAGRKNVEFDLSLARGLAYYTGTVYEAFLKKSDITSSIAAGGRYDEMIGGYVGGGRMYPAIGISFGVDVIVDALKAQKRKGRKSVVQAYVISIGVEGMASEIVELLRESSVNVDADYSGKVGRGIDFADSYGIPFVIFIGKRELDQGKVKIRDMSNGVEKMVAVDKAANFILKAL